MARGKYLGRRPLQSMSSKGLSYGHRRPPKTRRARAEWKIAVSFRGTERYHALFRILSRRLHVE